MRLTRIKLIQVFLIAVVLVLIFTPKKYWMVEVGNEKLYN